MHTVVHRGARGGYRRSQKCGITLNAVYPSMSAPRATPLDVTVVGAASRDVPVPRPVAESMAVTADSEAP